MSQNRCVQTRVLAGVGVATTLLVGGLLAIWLVPTGPSILRPGAFSGFNDGYVGAHYVSWPAFSAQAKFKIDSIEVRVDDPARCAAVVRRIKRPTESFATVTDGPVPGAAAIGGSVTHAISMDYAVVLTPRQVGECSVTSIVVGTRSWGRIRTSAITSQFTVTTAHASGIDPRVGDTPNVR
jgi:hypothetical protein